MGSKQGWISIHRSIQDHYLWDDKPFSKGQAWIDMILMANHADNKFLLGNELVTVERGTFITSELKLMERWGWSKTKVRAFMQLLENDSMIVKKTDRKKTTITLVNYSVYQNLQTTEEPQKNHEQTANRPQKDTNNNENNELIMSNKKNTPVRHKYGKYNNVLLSDTDMEKLKAEFPSDYGQRIEILSEYIAMKGDKYKNHLAVIRKWAKTDKNKGDYKQNDSTQRQEYYQTDFFN